MIANVILKEGVRLTVVNHLNRGSANQFKYGLIVSGSIIITYLNLHLLIHGNLPITHSY